jgi:hypothetical protein
MYTLQGKTRSTYHMLSTLSPHMVLSHTYLTRSMYINISRSRQQRWTEPLLPRKMAPDTNHSMTTDRSMGPYLVSLPEATIEAVGANPYQHAIGTLNTCSWGSIHRSLTDTVGGYNLRGASFPHTTPRPSQSVISTFYLRAPFGLQLNHIPPTKPKLNLRNLWPPRGLLTTRSSTETYIYA